MNQQESTMERQILAGKVAIVTGAGMGMGEATAILFAEEGARVMVCDIDGEAGGQTVEAITAAGGDARFHAVDVADEASVADMVRATVAAYGRLDCAVNNAGITPDTAMVADTDLAVFDRIIAVNLRSVLASMKYQIRQFLAQGGGGAIVNISSVSGVRPQVTNSAYVAAKHGVIGLTKTASVEYASQGIRVNCVLPGAIDTPMIRKAFEGFDIEPAEYAPIMSLFGRLGTPREVAQGSLWLCSDMASYVTGHSLAVDAGYTSR